MKSVLVLVTVAVLLALMVSSVSANGSVQRPTPDVPPGVTTNNVVIKPPTIPCAASCTNASASASAEEGIASPHIFLKGAASGAEGVVIKPPTIPAAASNDTVTPMAGGSTIKIIVTSKRAVTIEDDDIGGGTIGKPKPNGLASDDTVTPMAGGSTIKIIVSG